MSGSVWAVVSARMASARCPGKALAPLAGIPLLRVLLDRVTPGLREIPGLKLYGDVPAKVPLVSFTLDGVHPHDIGTILDREGIAIRTGHHCAQPVMERFCIPATARASFALYNTRSDVDRLVDAIHYVLEVFG